MEHRLKSWPEYFHAIRHGLKTFEIRKNDRGFNLSDELIFEEWSPITRAYTGNVETGWSIVYLLKNIPGIEPGYCVMGIERL